MNDLEVINFEGIDVLDSRDVAKMMGKRHTDLLRDIAKYEADILANADLRSLNFFIPSTYVDKQGKTRKCYLLTKQGCEFCANKMTGKKGNQFTAQYVSIFNKMKNHIEQVEIPSKFNIPQTLPEALRLAADQAEQLAKQKPKVDYYDSMLRNPGLMTVTEMAKDYGWGAKTMNSKLHEMGIQYKQGDHWVLYAKYADKGYAQSEPFPYKTNSHGRKGVKNNLKWTQRGRKFVYDELAKLGIYPVLEQMDLLEGGY